LMAICRTNLRQIATRHMSPSRVLIELNRALSHDIQAGLFITMVYAIINVATDEVTLARAGHELPLLIRRDAAQGISRADFVGSEGMALGLVPDEIFAPTIEDRVELLGAADVLVLYTDGVTEAPNDEDKEYSGARLADVVRSTHQRSSKEINDAILESVQRFAGDASQRDDFTLVTVKRR
jgi:phosphoserine phosphatase RsbU/P